MLDGLKGQDRLANIVANVVNVMRIVAGEYGKDHEVSADTGKGSAAISVGKLGGTVRTEKLKTDQYVMIARKAARLRWKA